MKNATNFLIGSFIVIIVVLSGSMAMYSHTMRNKNESAINDIGKIYMQGINEKIDVLFENYVTLRMSQVNAIIENTPPAQFEYGEEMMAALAKEGELREFEYLALLTRDGDLVMIYGNPLILDDRDAFLQSLNESESKVACAVDENGQNVVLMGVSAEYPMGDDKVNTALVCGFSSSSISDLLSLNDTDSMLFSHIVRKDGSYVIKNEEEESNNYFTRIRTMFSGVDNKEPEDYINELQDAMEGNRSYSTIFLIGSERRHLYCTPLPNSEWFLLTIMPYGTLDTTISSLNAKRTQTIFVCILLISITLVAIFLYYFRMSQVQIHELQKARQEADRANKAKSEFLSNMSHDIRTPMNAILGMTAIAITNIGNEAQVKNCLQKITVSGQHLLGLINDILDMSKIESGKMTLNRGSVSLCELTDSIVDITQPQIKNKKQIFDVLISNILAENVICDSLRMNQVLLNLLSNAIKFTPEGGCIQLLIHQEPSSLGDNYVQLHIDVKDSGIGMTPEFMKHIFDPFAREDNKRVQKTEGTGLGMPITKYIIDAMNGSIEVKSNPGNGTQFHVILDLEKAQVREADMMLPAMDVLVVDDDEILCRTASASLEEIGLTADWTTSSSQALEMIRKRQLNDNMYHVILLDWKMPEMDGMELAKRIREMMGPDVPIILISAYDWSDAEEHAKAAGISGFITKPLFKSTLYYGIRQYVEADLELPPLPEEKRTDFSGTKILLAEDNDLNWEIAYELLSEYGLDVERAEDGKQCLEKFSASAIGFYKLILMDIRMPIMDGYGATEAIRKTDRADADLPIIAMTADAFSEDIQRCLDCGMNSHIAKPIDMKRVVQILQQYIPAEK